MFFRAALRPARSLHPTRQLRAHVRWESTRPSPVTDFYKTFTRPVAKTLLLAVFTYQLAYWAWVKLEQDEIKAERREEISQLEAQVQSLQADDKKR
ncbi:hypothetical protein QBC33DRAFT_541780 [Phialemonium atrogriseum]|uniref:Inner membrane assembly complex subunit 17 n=1 Tax=Phialemonium atrogriseum TaxID=1093897 RepID=A0AAJ0BX38_9PEZI|nr:uncharacterized protein QBC33DRAFT_541780 [Phialemonium atrogriseum]KAK1766088.1 hypothetical protein QBC33DRAFT_541780 [Phialemonium atrogriseum]